MKSKKNEFKYVPIKELGTVITGKTPSTRHSENFNGNIPFITIPDLDGRTFIDKTKRTLSNNGAKEIHSCLLPPGSIMLSCIATVGKCGITVKPSFTNQQINSLIPNDTVAPRFIYYCFTQIGKELENIGGGGSVYTNVSKSRFSDIEIPIPPLPEQRAIAHILGTLDDKIELNRRMNETLEAMAQALFKSWFVDFDPVRAKAEGRPTGLPKEIEDLFPDGFEESELGEIPRGWRIGKLGEITDLQNGYAFKSSDWVDNGVPVIKIGSVKPSIVDTENVTFITESLANTKLDFRLFLGDILVGLTGYVGEVGRIPPCEIFPILNQRVARFKAKLAFNNLLLPAFIYSCVRDSRFKKFAEEKSHGSAQANVSTNDLLKYNIPIGIKEIMLTFEKIIDPIYQKVLINAGETKNLMRIRSLLLPKLLSGEMRVFHS